VGDYVRDQLLRSLTVATAAGFILGGGLNSRLGLAMLTFVGQIACRRVVTSTLVESLHAKQNEELSVNNLRTETSTTLLGQRLELVVSVNWWKSI
jgi:hypothetical protein